MDAISAFVSGIKCNAKDCNYVNDFGSWGETPGALMATADKHLNVPCPLCGTNLLTQADYNVLSSLIDISDAINEIFGEMPDYAEKVKLHISLDGSGDITVDTPSK